jgi:hypothetical protein
MWETICVAEVLPRVTYIKHQQRNTIRYGESPEIVFSAEIDLTFLCDAVAYLKLLPV